MEKQNVVTIALIDDDEVLRDDFIKYFQRSDCDDIRCALTTDSVAELVSHSELDINIIFLDIGLYGENSLRLLSELRAAFPDSQVIIYSIYEDTEIMLQAFILGAAGYLSKRVPLSEVKTYIDLIRNGGAALSPEMAKRLVQHFNIDEGVNTQFLLNEKESQILRMLSEAWTYKKIASALFLSVDGVRYYIKSIYSKLNVTSRSEAVGIYLAHQRKI